MRLDKNKRLKNSVPDNFRSCENSDIIVPRGVLLRAVLTTKKQKNKKQTETKKSTPTKTTFRSNNDNKG